MLEWGEHTEFISHHLDSFREVWAVILEPPWWGNILLLIGGGTLIWWDLRRSPIHLAIADTTPPPPPPAKELSAKGPWFSSLEIGNLGDDTLITQANVDARALTTIEREYREVQDEIYSLNQKTGIAAIIDGMANTSDVAQDVVKLESAKQRAKEVFANVQKATTLRNASYNAAIDDIYRKLQNGDLVAKGFLIPIDINSEEIIIPASRWRFLKFNKDFTEASGEGIEYKAIAVARRS